MARKITSLDLFIQITGLRQKRREISIEDINAQHIIKYRDKRLEEDLVSKKTVDLELGAIKRFLAYALDKFGLKVNPAMGITVKRTRAEKKRETRAANRRPPTHDEADKLLPRVSYRLNKKSVHIFPCAATEKKFISFVRAWLKKVKKLILLLPTMVLDIMPPVRWRITE